MKLQTINEDGILVSGAENEAYNGEWREARGGTWCRYIGSAFRTGGAAPEPLIPILKEHAKKEGFG